MKQRPFCDQRPSMLKNPLLQRAKVGQTIRSTQDLPDEDYRYGKVYRDTHTVAECLKWDKPQPKDDPRRRRAKSRQRSRSPSPTSTVSTASMATGTIRRDERAIWSPSRFRQPVGYEETGPRRDFVATNKAALKAGCVNSKEYREFQKSVRINVKPEENLKAAEDEFARAQHRAMVHGIPTPVSSEMKDCLTWQGYREAKERAVRMREIKAARKEARQAMRPKGVRHTRASRGHTYKPDPPPTYAETYKIPRYRDIQGYKIDDKW